MTADGTDVPADVHSVAGSFVADCGIHDHATANARLIAAAPDLLAALKAILLMRHAMSQNAHVDDRLCEIAEAAIAKAEGR
jgi:hypothetical protein